MKVWTVIVFALTCLAFGATAQNQDATIYGGIYYANHANYRMYGANGIPRTDHTNLDTLTNVLKGDLRFDTLNAVVVVYDGTAWVDLVAGSSNTLDEAYDQGGAGAGRSITADAGAVWIDGNFQTNSDSIFFGNDSLDIGIGGTTKLGGGYHVDNGELSIFGYLPNGWLGSPFSSYEIRMTSGDTSSSLKVFRGGNDIDQLFDLSSSIGAGSQGFETQITAGLNQARMYSTSFDGSVNLSVIDVDTTKIALNILGGSENISFDADGFHTTTSNVGFGTSTPDTTLHVVGQMKYEDGNETEGYILTSDANGVATWSPNGLGGISYVDTTYSLASPYTVASVTETIIPFFWDSIGNNGLPSSVDSLFSRADTTIIGKTNRWMSMTFYFKAEGSATNQWIDVWLDLGGAVGERYRITFSMPKGMGVERSVIYNIAAMYNAGTWETNGAKMYIESNATLDIYDMILNLKLDYEP